MAGFGLIHILPFITLLIFIFSLNKRCTVQTYLLSILYLLPLMNLRITNEEWGGFTTFDVINFFCFFFFIKEFNTLSNSRQTNFYFLLCILFILIATIGSLASEFPADSLSSLVRIFPIFIYARFLSAECFRDQSFVPKIIKAFKFGYIIALLFLVLQLIWGLKVTFYNTLGDNTVMLDSNVVRYPGYFFDSQLNGQYLAMVSFIFLYTIRNGYKHNIANYSVFAVAIVAIFLAGSRSAFGGFCVGLFVVFLLARNQYRIILSLLLIAGFALFIIFLPANGVLNRANSIEEDYDFRQSIWQDAFEIAKNHPFVGIGVGNYKNHTTKYYQDQYFLVDDELIYFEHPENGYLKILVEFGFLGFAVFAVLIVSPLVTVLQTFLKSIPDNNVSFLIAGLFSWLVAFNTVYSLWDYRILICVTTLLVLLNSHSIRERITLSRI